MLHLWSLLLLLSAPPQAASAPAGQANALAPLEFLIGEWGQGSVQRNYRWLLGRRYLEMRETTEGGRTTWDSWQLFGVDPATGKLTLWEFASDGTMVALTQSADSAAGEVRFEGRFRSGGQSGPLRVTFKKLPGGFTQVLEQQREGEGQGFSLEFAPLSAAAPPHRPAIDSPAKGSPLAALGKFAGVWLIEGESEGRKFTVEYAFGWAVGGRYFTTSYSVGMGSTPDLHALSIIGYDPDTKELVQRGFNAEGSVLRAKVTIAGDTFTWEGQMTGAENRGLRSTYTLKDADTLEFTTEIRQGDKWTSLGAAPMKRKK